MQKKNWKKLKELISDCYMEIIGQNQEEDAWNKAFEQFIKCIQEERNADKDFAKEFYEVDNEIDYACDISGWMPDYFDELDMKDALERMIEVADTLSGLFAWKEQSKSEINHRKASALSRLGKHEESIKLCEEWYREEKDNPLAAASLIQAYLGIKNVEKAEKIVDDYYSDTLACTWETEPFYAAASAVYQANGDKEKYDRFEKAREEFDQALGEWLYGEGDEYDDEYDGELPFDF